MLDKKGMNIHIAITMPIDTLADSLFPLSTLERILNGSEKGWDHQGKKDTNEEYDAHAYRI